MDLFIYYKGHEKKGVWKVAKSDRTDEILARESVGFVTVLCITEKKGPGESVSEDAQYQGPLYIDIDDDNIAKSIKAAQKTLKKLTNAVGIPEEVIRIYATGKRGFHFLIPMECFTEAKPVRKLPLTYKFMVNAFKLPNEVDHTVYSCGKGRMWRIASKKRVDNGKYKVRISAEELRELDAAKYEALITEPRDESGFKNSVAFVPMLNAIYKNAAAKAAEAAKPIQVFIDPEMKQLLEGELPPCGQQMKNFENIKKGKGFNDVSVQFAKAVVAFAPNEAKDLVQEFAENSTGESYNTVTKRKSHTNTAVRIAAKNADYQWSCKAALTVLKNEPCFDCPLAHIRMEQEEQTAEKKEKIKAAVNPLAHSSVKEDEVEDEEEVQEPVNKASPLEHGSRPKDVEQFVHKIEEEAVTGASENHYEDEEEIVEDAEDILASNREGLLSSIEGFAFMTGDGSARRISNFTLRITQYYLERCENLRQDRRTAVMADLLIGGKSVGQALIEEENWNSKSALIKCLGGIANAAFYGKDDDVQKMKSALMENIEQTAEKIRRVRTIGIHRERIGTQDVFTYVEPGWSIDQFGNENKYYLAEHVEAAPRLYRAAIPEKGDPRVTEILRQWFRVNKPVVVAQILGWYVAAILKQHVLAIRNQFPLLGVHGSRGSGKTTTVSLFGHLHGVDYLSEESPVSAASVTPFVVWRTISGSTTVPRIVEEYNKSKVKRYDEYGEYFKDCWNGFEVKRGAVGRKAGSSEGVYTQGYKLSAPVVVCSEQGIMMPALVQRTVQVEVSPENLEEDGVREAFEYCQINAEDIMPGFAKLMYMKALVTPVEVVDGWMKKYKDRVPMQLGDRPNYSYRVVLMGLEFLKELIKEYEFGVEDEVEELQEAIFTMLAEEFFNLATQKKRSEIDIVITKLAVMAALSDKEGGVPWMVRDSHYVVNGNYLYLDGMVAHSQYVRYMAQIERSPAVIEDYQQFKPLLKSEPYCESLAEIVEDFARGRPAIKLDIAKMQEKGIDVSPFTQ